jgi:pyruvate carboxylase
MGTAVEQITEFAMKLKLSKTAGEKLVQRANESGRDLASVASDLIERAVTQPTVDEVLAPFRKQVADSGMSEEELEAFFDDVREKAFQERHRRHA